MAKCSAIPLDAHLGYWLRFVSNHVSHAFKLKVEAHGITVAEWVILRTLFDAKEMIPSQIADQLGMTRGAISKLVDRAAAKGMVKCFADKDDRRFQAVSLTSAGRKLVPALAALADQNDAEFFGHLSDKQRSELIALLRDIVRQHRLKDVPTTPADKSSTSVETANSISNISPLRPTRDPCLLLNAGAP